MSSFGVNLFGLGSNECGSVDPVDGTVTADLNWCDDFSDVMDDAFTAESWDQTEDRTNAWTDGQDWADADKAACGDDEDDPDATDFAEVAQLCTHGGSTVDHTNLIYKSCAKA